MTTSATFWTGLARKYAASPIKNQDAYRATLDRTVSYLGQDDRVLEIGCGTGSTALLLAEKVGAYLGTDYSQGMIEIAREKLAESGCRNLSFLTADVFDEHLEAGGDYDAILAFNLFHLIENPDAVLARARSLLKPGGMLISKTVCLGHRSWLFGPLIAVMRLFGKAPYVNLLSRNGLEQMIADAGFEIVETGDYPINPPSRFIVARKTD